MRYPDSDGQPVADNTNQFRWIATIQGGLDAFFRQQPDVFIAGDLLWYPVQGDPRTRIAPDVLVAFDRPKGERGSYRQWREAGIAPQVVFEILSPTNTRAEMTRKAAFYLRYGVEEFYIYDPDTGEFAAYIRDRSGPEHDWRVLINPGAWLSPRLGIRFTLDEEKLVLERPDGRRIVSYVELGQLYESERDRADLAEMQANAERARAERLAARLRALGIDPTDLES
ncbi:MAG: Uma2 family endonuclease [Chloroflexaceae bacterium]|nr:Uma2 family endonuclease [Chloroflexaceae bacterium]